MIVEIPDHRTNICDYLLENGWKWQFTWLELVRWLDERARQKVANLWPASISTSSRKFC